jgi:hypothetical protein
LLLQAAAVAEVALVVMDLEAEAEQVVTATLLPVKQLVEAAQQKHL